jgi:hypothetical protein
MLINKFNKRFERKFKGKTMKQIVPYDIVDRGPIVMIEKGTVADVTAYSMPDASIKLVVSSDMRIVTLTFDSRKEAYAAGWEV